MNTDLESVSNNMADCRLSPIWSKNLTVKSLTELTKNLPEVRWDYIPDVGFYIHQKEMNFNITAQMVIPSTNVKNTAMQNGFEFEYRVSAYMNTYELNLWTIQEGNTYRIKAKCGNNKDLEQTINVSCGLIINKILTPKTQSGPTINTMENDDIIAQTEVSDIAENTEITQAADVAENVFVIHPSNVLNLQDATKTLPTYTYPALTNRYLDIASGSFTTADAIDDVILSLDIPSALYAAFDSSTSTIFRPFVLISTDIEINIKINANQAQCGRYVAAFYPCKKQAFGAPDSVYMQVQREHTEIDIATSSDACFVIKYENLRPWLPIQTDEVAITTGESFGVFTIRCLGGIRVISGANGVVPFQVFAKFSNLKLTAMRYPVPVQSGIRVLTKEEIQQQLIASGIESNPGPPVVSTPAKAKALDVVKFVNQGASTLPVFGPIYRVLANIGANATLSITRLFATESFTKNLESNLIYAGMKNKDKPVDIRPNVSFQPTAQKALCHGLGPIIATKMRLEMVSTTPQDDIFHTVQSPQSFSQLAQIGGIQTRFVMTTDMLPRTLLTELPAAPYDPRYLPPSFPLGTETCYWFPPAAYFVNQFQGYVGEIEYEFIPIKTPSHNFSILVAYVPLSGNPGTTTYEQALSCHYKVIDFRSNTTGFFTVPYVSTTLFRGMPGVQMNQLASVITAPGDVMPESQMQFDDPGKVVVFVVNPLNVTPIVSPTIDVLVKMRAKENMQFVQPCPQRLKPLPTMDSLVLQPVTPGGATTWPRPQAPGPVQIASGDEVLGEARGPLPGFQIQALEIHDSIPNVMRRAYSYLPVTLAPYMSDAGDVIQGSAYGAILPIVPCDPKFRISNNGLDINTRIRSDQLLNSYPRNPRDSTVACFRWIRGSMTLSIINNSDFNLIITHFPPQARPTYLNGFTAFQAPAPNKFPFVLIGPFQPGLGGPDSTGYPSVRNVPQVNRVTDIEIPFYQVNNYVDVQSRYAPFMTQAEIDINPDNMIGGKFNDVISRYFGHVAIQLETSPGLPSVLDTPPINLQTKLSFGDDTELMHFMGCPPMALTPLATPTPTARIVSRKQTKQEIQTRLIMAGIESNPGPVVTPQAPQGSLMSTITQKGKDFHNMVKNMFSGSANFFTDVRAIREHGDLLTTTIEKIKTWCAAYTNLSYVQLTVFAVSMINAWKNPNYFSMSTLILTFLMAIGIMTDETFSGLISKLMFWKSEPTTQAFNQQKHVQHFAPLIGAAFIEFFSNSAIREGYDVDKAKIDTNYVYKRIAKALGSINWFRFSVATVVLTKILSSFMWLADTITTWLFDTCGITCLLKGNDRFVSNFMKDHAFLMTQLNENAIMNLRHCRDRFWTTLLSAHYLNNVMAKQNVKNPTLMRACNDVIRKSNELSVAATLPPVRYEPFYIWVHGPPGVGKSTMMGSITTTVLSKLSDIGWNFQHANPIYTRRPDIDFWNGYSNQPIVLYDDVGFISEPSVNKNIVSELQTIKSSVVMPLNMARLEEKTQTMVSNVLIVLSNKPNFRPPELREPEAFERRRDLLVHAKFSSEAIAHFNTHKILEKDWNTTKLPKEMVDKNKHVVFGIHKEVVARNDGSSTTPGEYMSYDDFVTLYSGAYLEYHKKEAGKMADRYTQSLALLPSLVKNLTDDASVKAALLQMTLQVEERLAGTPYDTLKNMLYNLEMKVPMAFQELPISTQENLRQLAIKSPPEFVSRKEPMKTKAEASFFKEIKNYSTSLWNYVDDVVSGTSTWREPLQVNRIKLPQNTTCIKCNSVVQRPLLMCINSEPDDVHAICDCFLPTLMEIQHTMQNKDCKIEMFSCAICRTNSMKLGIPDIMKNPYTVAAKFLTYLRSFMRRGFDALESYGIPSKMKSDKIISLCVTSTLISQHLKRLHAHHVQSDNPSLRRFVEYTGSLPVDMEEDDTTITYTSIFGSKFFVLKNDSLFNIRQATTPQAPGSSGDLSDVDDDFVDIFPLDPYVFKGLKEEEIVPLITNAPKFPVCPHAGFAPDHISNVVQILNRCSSDKNALYTLSRRMGRDTEGNPCPIFDIDICLVGRKEPLIKVMLTMCPEGCPISDCVPHCVLNMIRDDIHMLRISEYPLPQVIIDIIELIDKKSKNTEDNKTSKKCPAPPNPEHQGIQSDLEGGFIKRILGAAYCVYEFIRDYAVTIISFLAIAIALTLGAKWYWCEKEEVVIVEAQVQGEGSNTPMSQKEVLRHTQRTLAPSKILSKNTQGLSLKAIPTAVQITCDKIKKSLVSFMVGTSTFNAVGIAETTVMMPRHFYYAMIEYQKLYPDIPVLLFLSGSSTPITVQLDKCPIKDEKSSEMVFVELPSKGISNFKNLYKMFPQGYDEEGQEVVLSVPYHGWVMDMSEHLAIKGVGFKDVEPNTPMDGDTFVNGEYIPYRNTEVREVFTSTIEKPGMCLSPYILKSGQLLGWHVAGHYDTGFGVVIFREHISKFKPISITPEDPDFEHPNIPKIQSGETDMPNITFIAEVYNPPYHTGKTKIIPSPLQSVLYAPEKFPCIQSSKDPRYVHGGDPLLDSASTLGSPTHSLNQDVKALAISAVSDETMEHMPSPYAYPPVSIKEAITADHAHHVQKMDLNTSAGYPLIMQGLAKKKKDFCRKSEVITEFLPKIQKQLEQAFEKRCKGEYVDTVYYAALKDELRPFEKLMKKGGTRLFSVAPNELCVNSRRAMLPFMDAFQSDPINLHHAIGLNPNSSDWRQLIDRLRQKGQKLIQMDFKNYSDCIPSEFVYGAFGVIERYYEQYGLMTSELSNCLQSIADDIAHSKILIKDKIYRVNNGVLAGHPLTSIINSLVNLMMQCYIWTLITKRLASEFFRVCYIMVMGDDVVISVPDWIIETYNCTKICAAFKEHLGITATDGSKNTENIMPYDEFEDFEFLSRGYSQHPLRYGVLLAPLKPTAIFEVPLWITKSDDDESRIVQSIQAALINAYDHGPLFFKKFKNLIVNNSITPQTNYWSWDELDVLFHGSFGLLTPKKLIPDAVAVGAERNRALGENLAHLVERKPMIGKKKVVSWRCGCKYDCMSILDTKIEQSLRAQLKPIPLATSISKNM